jgi:exopolysaccharide biosynthesis polyprenyl glycosylphosphotransferase
MSSVRRALLFLVSDLVAVSTASVLFLWMKHVGGRLESVHAAWFRLMPQAADGPSFPFVLRHYLPDALPAISVAWVILFLFYGLYRSTQSLSRFDEVLDVVKVVTLGTGLVFVATFDPVRPFGLSRALMVSYWASMVVLVAGGRVLVRSFERQLLVRGIGRRHTVVVGVDARGTRLLAHLRSSPALGYQVVGFVRARQDEGRTEVDGLAVLGGVSDLARIIAEHHVEVVLIALQSNSHEEVLEIVNAAEGQPVSFSITPDLYDIVTGHVRTQQIYGVPLMELRPGLMPAWEQTVKRGVDLAVAVVVLGGLAPLWLLIAVLIKLTSPGPVLFRQERVGRGGKPFMMYKFRSMRSDAEARTGPVWVSGADPRVTPVGRVLRALHLDEVPQCLNFLNGDMSLVGPRPERPFFVERFRQQIPFYMRRFNVKPGLLGWAQSKHQFDLNSDDLVAIARERLEYDLYYIENMSLRLDLKIMLQTVWFVLAGRSTR